MFKKIVILLLSLTLVGCTNNPPKETEAVVEKEQSQEFIKLLDDEFINYLESDFLNYHYTIKDGSAYNAEKPEVTLGSISLEDYSSGKEVAETSLKQLNEIDVTTLNSEQTRQYNILKRYFEDSIVGYSYPLFDNYFAPSTGITSNLITNMEEFKFYNEQDVKDYLVILADIQRYFADAITFTEMQIAEGHFMNDFTINQTVDGIDKFISKVDDNQFIASFNDKIDELNLENVEAYKEENKKIVTEEVIPAYATVKEFLLSNKGTTPDDMNLSGSPEGKKYYEDLIQLKLGTNLSIEELSKMGLTYIQNKVKKIIPLFGNEEAMTGYEEFAVDFETPEEMLMFLQENITKAYPQGPEVTYEASYLDPTVADENIVAYYLIPPLDSPTENIIRINGDNVDDEYSLYTTLAHEGFPGHLYQNTYYFDKDVHPLFKVLTNLGYGEGWAMMTELESINWVADEDIATLLGFDIEYGYIMQAIVDLGVNYNGWGTKEISDLLGITDEAVLQELYEGVVSEPGQITPYGLGLMLFKTYENEAKEALGDKFNQIDFNKVILDGGNRAFEFVKEDVNTYVEKNK